MNSFFLAPGEIANNKITPRFVLICFVLGAIAGTTGDFVHVITNTDGYPANGPFPFLPLIPVRMPVWVPFLFGSAMLLMGCSHKMLVGSYTPRLSGSTSFAIASLPLFIFIYACTGFVHAGTGSGQDIWLAAVAILLWWFADRTFTGALLAVVNAIGGTLFEMFLVHAHGFFYYPEHANFFGVPSWLPWLYAVAGIVVSVFVRRVR